MRAFAAERAEVAVHYHSSRLHAEALADETGGVALGADLTSEHEADGLVPEVVRSLGGLDVCVANAGAYPADPRPLWEIPLERWRRVLDENLTSMFLTSRGHADYAASKGAVMTGLLASLKNEVAALGAAVRVNAVAPGWTATPKRVEAGIDPAHVERATATMALKKLASPDDVAAQVVVLASDRLSGHVTGEVVTVAGGMEGRLL